MPGLLPSRGARSGPRPSRLALEPLEDRCLLSANVFNPSGGTTPTTAQVGGQALAPGSLLVTSFGARVVFGIAANGDLLEGTNPGWAVVARNVRAITTALDAADQPGLFILHDTGNLTQFTPPAGEMPIDVAVRSISSAVDTAGRSSLFILHNDGKVMELTTGGLTGPFGVASAIGTAADAGVPRLFALLPDGSVLELDDSGLSTVDSGVTQIASIADLPDQNGGVALSANEDFSRLTHAGFAAIAHFVKSFSVDQQGTPHVVYDILAKWRSLGGASGELGAPVSAEEDAPGGGRIQYFEHGYIYDNPDLLIDPEAFLTPSASPQLQEVPLPVLASPPQVLFPGSSPPSGGGSEGSDAGAATGPSSAILLTLFVSGGGASDEQEVAPARPRIAQAEDARPDREDVLAHSERTLPAVLPGNAPTLGQALAGDVAAARSTRIENVGIALLVDHPEARAMQVAESILDGDDVVPQFARFLAKDAPTPVPVGTARAPAPTLPPRVAQAEGPRAGAPTTAPDTAEGAAEVPEQAPPPVPQRAGWRQTLLVPGAALVAFVIHLASRRPRRQR
jgi:hypothetical protein